MYTAILLLPLLGAVIAGFFHRQIGERAAMLITTGILMFCAVLSWIAFFSLGDATSIELFRWISSGELEAFWSIRVDRLTTVMLVVVTTVSSLVHMYSIGYMDEDDAKPRFFAYLSFFTFAMLALVTGDNLADLLRLGGRWCRVLSVDWFLVQEKFGQCCGHQSICGEQDWRFRLFARHVRIVLHDGFDHAGRRVCRGCQAGRRIDDVPWV